MNRPRRLVCSIVLAAACGVVWPSARGAAQVQPASPPLKGAVLNPVGLAVKDIERTAAAYAEVFGVPVPKIATIQLDLPGGGRARLKVTNFPLPNFHIDLAQPLEAETVFTPLLEKYGDAIHHLGYAVPDRLSDRVEALRAQGGKVTLVGPGSIFTFVDLTSKLGTTIELMQQTAAAPAAAPPTPTTTLGRSAVAHVGRILSDVERTAKMFAELSGQPAPKFIVAKGIDFPPDYKGNRAAEVRISMASGGGVTLELQQDPGVAGGPNPWNDSARRLGGDGVEHVAFTIESGLNDVRRDLAAAGGREVLGGPGSRYPHFEMFSTLGMMVELLGDPAK